MAQVDVCNMALSKLGAGTITLITDEPHGPLCALFYDNCRLSLLERETWRFAVLREEIEDDGTAVADAVGFEYRFLLSALTSPVRILDVMYENGTSIDWLREGEYLYANYDTTTVKHVTDVSDDTKWPSLFTEAMALRLAAAIAIRVKASVAAQQRIAEEYEQILLRARQLNAVEENDPDDLETGSTEWLDSRS